MLSTLRTTCTPRRIPHTPCTRTPHSRRHLNGSVFPETSAPPPPPLPNSSRFTPPPLSNTYGRYTSQFPTSHDRFATPDDVAGVQGGFLDGSSEKLRDITKFSQLPENFGINQHIQIDDALRETLRAALWKFKAPIRYAFAYGSGVFSQGQKYTQKPQVDLIFGVTYTQHWHSLNMAQYPEHYSLIRYFGSGAVSYVQDRLGAGVYFNPYVEINGLTIKYGVVNIDTLCRDLLTWDTLYLSGRLHKPVKILRDDPRVRMANQRNLFSVVRTALLLLPEKFSEHDLYRTIASISYTGDPRMDVGAENPNKVVNIVHNQMPHFHRLYAPLIDTLPNLQLCGLGDDTITLAQDMDPQRRGNVVARLPAAFRQKLYARYTTILGVDPTTLPAAASTENARAAQGTQFDQMIASHSSLPEEVSRVIKHTVKWPSAVQGVKGLATAGPLKSVQYLGEKYSKWRTGKAKQS
ncbi:mitochondrial matrix Mmp37-domain-containing protein [Limtongia smithiae]|uniref:mitochondrial matrix Mmp37-domain-containing protein n=1 Tax=Limtongia smithiae TaxID=1125753 RepID=UPI0034CDEE21